MSLVSELARQRTGRALAEDDLVQEGSLAALDAVDSFTGEPAGFEAYVRERVGARMDAALGAEDTAVKETDLIVAAAIDFDRAEYVLARELRRKPTSLELAARLGWSAERVESVRELVEEARRRHDEELLQYLEADRLDLADADGSRNGS